MANFPSNLESLQERLRKQLLTCYSILGGIIEGFEGEFTEEQSALAEQTQRETHALLVEALPKQGETSAPQSDCTGKHGSQVECDIVRDQRNRIAHLERQLALYAELEKAMAESIGVREGQTFEERAEELGVMEVTVENMRAAETECKPVSSPQYPCICREYVGDALKIEDGCPVHSPVIHGHVWIECAKRMPTYADGKGRDMSVLAWLTDVPGDWSFAGACSVSYFNVKGWVTAGKCRYWTHLPDGPEQSKANCQHEGASREAPSKEPM